MAAQTMQAMSNQSRAAANMAGNSVATTAAAGLFDPHSQSTMNYALKPEKGLPPTPPGKWNGMNDGVKGFPKKDFGIMILFILKITSCSVLCMSLFVTHNLK